MGPVSSHLRTTLQKWEETTETFVYSHLKMPDNRENTGPNFSFDTSGT